MKRSTVRRIRNLVMLSILVAVALWWGRLSHISLRDVSFPSGWILLAMILLLTGYNLRKKFPFLPLGTSSQWLQIHIYVGLLSIVFFGLHLGWRIPNGVFEVVLAALYVMVCGSGIVGLIVSRLFARRLTLRGPEIIYERIARLRNRLRRETEQLVLHCLATTGSEAIPEFYSQHLESFFAAPKNFGMHLIRSLRPRKLLLSEIDAHRRFLNDEEKKFMTRIEERVKAKDDLDFQFAHQATLKYWLFFHIPLTYALVVFAVVHTILVHAFLGIM